MCNVKNIVILIHELVTVRSFQNISSIQNSPKIFEGFVILFGRKSGGSKFSPGFDTFFVTDFRSSGFSGLVFKYTKFELSCSNHP